MPNPKKGETQQEFVSRAVPMLIREGRPRLQAIAIAYSMWRRRNKKAKQ